jgi:integrase
LAAHQLPEFFKRLKAYESRGKRQTILAIHFMMHTFVRNKEMRCIQVEDIDWKWKLVRIEKDNMKGKKRPHVVPLNNQALAIVEELIEMNGGKGYIFPSVTSLDKPMSDGTINKALRAMGYDTKTEVTTHGFRTTASSTMNEATLWNPDAIEKQLAHVEENKTRKAYTHKASYLRQRVEMMAWWGDFLEGVENGTTDPMEVILGDADVAYESQFG